MTGKRFIDGGEECVENQFLIDTETDTNYWIDKGLDDIIDLLNEQHEQIQSMNNTMNATANYNKFLECKITNLEKEAEVYNLDAMNYQTLYEQQVEKNNRLKQEIERLKEYVEKFAENQTQHNLWRLRTVINNFKYIKNDGDVE